MNVKLKKFKILEPKVKIKTNVNIFTREIKESDFTTGNLAAVLKNNVTMLTGIIEEE